METASTTSTAPKIDIKAKMKSVDNEIQLLQSSNKKIVSELHELQNREQMNTSRLEDTSNLKSSYLNFTEKFNASIGTVSGKLLAQDNKIEGLEKTITSTLSEFKASYEKMIADNKASHDKELAELRSTLKLQNDYIDTQLNNKMTLHNSNLSQCISTVRNEMDNVNKKITILENVIIDVKSNLMF